MLALGQCDLFTSIRGVLIQRECSLRKSRAEKPDLSSQGTLAETVWFFPRWAVKPSGSSAAEALSKIELINHPVMAWVGITTRDSKALLLPLPHPSLRLPEYFSLKIRTEKVHAMSSIEKRGGGVVMPSQ